ncbi:hypothetical protein GNE08_13610 [Trichormus variabilis ARAD]|uniref:Transposase n=1 Tax=Trichormus variabilis N2B TaxID=2681315 RepID=A0ABR6SA56_ANAVA|nr:MULTISPECIES: hypothetical protein [Nostocaceae]MBC1215254.1 hypothetical protein [Trichormus variabilis ARAD]MBC1267190.1 hypothetical protein [Trichormus variabilis FSR]MBC1256659.1 hypothetical protein [Trichormus variabilis V5]MBC1303297.1 hypothetical protein [Trichormus variabilis N2B]MBC1329020.1 hypothetical protein [Trichormus variabilis 9RC]
MLLRINKLNYFHQLILVEWRKIAVRKSASACRAYIANINPIMKSMIARITPTSNH